MTSIVIAAAKTYFKNHLNLTIAFCTMENKNQDPAKWPNEGVFPSEGQVAKKGFAEEETKTQK